MKEPPALTEVKLLPHRVSCSCVIHRLIEKAQNPLGHVTRGQLTVVERLGPGSTFVVLVLLCFLLRPSAAPLPGMASQSQGIQQLLQAEKRAAEKVAEARKREYERRPGPPGPGHRWIRDQERAQHRPGVRLRR